MTAGDAARRLAERFAAAGIGSARLDARLLVAEVLGIEAGRILTHPETPLDEGQQARLEAMAARRVARQPMSHILGRRGFWTLTLAVTADTLDPRPDTETLVEAVLARLPDRSAPLSLLDFGTGSGCILLALLAELPNARGLGVDASAPALEVAIANAAANGLAERAEFRLGDWGSGLDGRFDAIVSNPPYIPTQDIDGLAPEVARFEPRRALDGGADGLDCYRALAPQVARLLAPGGICGLEVGQGQDHDVTALFAAAGLVPAGVGHDLAGIARCVLFGAAAGAESTR
ncbi:peptide chain release factor N(5)-glutamine methyltransferase [Magnetospirillum sp. UT-4]|uniref:peptide chain release factor N(5)-glutamine methyltransferase n=1 Tax=Magnetospirillum sp. UT-4 TaxID=2681467 RepID=UPI00137DCFC8|nr:peptide chain release factor N(5)-glutamine methyltransferase [Magnetospirillum sp. UT-4]CAA7616955.1 N5-glutamine methyltransferase, modifies release factors RF-1 and RF-2 [Magnetospirillum sp. UT-4]